jgi:hypothetical protein
MGLLLPGVRVAQRRKNMILWAARSALALTAKFVSTIFSGKVLVWMQAALGGERGKVQKIMTKFCGSREFIDLLIGKEKVSN